MEKKNLR